MITFSRCLGEKHRHVHTWLVDWLRPTWNNQEKRKKKTSLFRRMCVCSSAIPLPFISTLTLLGLSLDWLSIVGGCCESCFLCCCFLSLWFVMEVLNGSRQRPKKEQRIQHKSEPGSPAQVKCLSSTYRSFRDSDVSLQSFHLVGDTAISGLSHKSLTLTDIPEWTRRENSLEHNRNNSSKSIDTLHRSLSSILSTHESKSDRSEIADQGLLSCCSPEPPAGWPLVHRCLRTLSHGHWFQHWCKSFLRIFFFYV